jgi:hypothetical protein
MFFNAVFHPIIKSDGRRNIIHFFIKRLGCFFGEGTFTTSGTTRYKYQFSHLTPSTSSKTQSVACLLGCF